MALVSTGGTSDPAIAANGTGNNIGDMMDTNTGRIAPMASSPMTPSPQPSTPATPMAQPSQVNPNSAFQNNVQSPTSTPQPSTQINISNGQTPPSTTGQQSQTQAPGVNLQPGAQGADVQNLQNYLAQMGYMTPEQIASGPGSYGPKTTAAVAMMQKNLGLAPSAANGAYGTDTQQALQQKYQGLFNSMKGGATPDTSSQARTQLQGALTETADSSNNPVFASLSAGMAPIMQSLNQVLSNINNPGLTAVSLQSEYNTLREQYKLPEMNAQMMNMQNIMNGTENDIRDEITKTGGFVTDSQVQGMASARNKLVQKQYNALATQYSAAQQNVTAMMQYATQDQATSLQRSQATAQITESMASISAQMMNMGMTMQNNARSAVQYNVTQMGYKGLAESANGNPQMKGYYENMLGLAPGTLSDPTAVAGMDTYKDQQLQINNYKAAIAAFNAGYRGGSGTPDQNTPGIQPIGQVGVNPVDPSTLVRPPSVANGVPLSMTADQMQQYTDTQKSAHTDPGTNNVVAPGIGYYVHQSDGSFVLKASMPSDTDMQYNNIKQTIDNSPDFSGGPKVLGQYTTATNKQLSAFKDLGTYKVLSTVAPYMANIRAAQTNPGSISDLELLDSYVRLSKGGSGQVTGDQVDIALRGASIGDKASVLQQKLENGGVLSPNQRQQLVQLASQVYNENADDYKKIYVDAIKTLKGNSIPTSFWRQLPDLNSLLSSTGTSQ